MDFPENVLENDLINGGQFDFIPHEALITQTFDPSSNGMSIQDIELVNHVLESPQYIMNPQNPLNPSRGTLFMDHERGAYDSAFEKGDFTAQEKQKRVRGDSEMTDDSFMRVFKTEDGTDCTIEDDNSSQSSNSSSSIIIEHVEPKNLKTFVPDETTDAPESPQPSSPPTEQELNTSPRNSPEFNKRKGRKKPIERKKKPISKKRRVFETIKSKPGGGLHSERNTDLDEDAQLKLEEKKRKHRIIERTRRNKLNEGFKNLGQIVQKINRADILSAAIDKLQEFESRQRAAQAEISRLRRVVHDSERKVQSLALQNAPPQGHFKFPLYVPSSDVDYRDVFINSGVAMAICRIDGNFVDCNIAFEELTGYSRSELLTTNMFALTHAEDLPKMFACVRAMLTNKFFVCKAVKKWVQKNGKLFQCACMVSVVSDRETGKVKYFVCIGPPNDCPVEQLQLQQEMLRTMMNDMPLTSPFSLNQVNMFK